MILQDYNSSYDSLLSKVNSKSLYKRRLQTLLISLLSTSYSLQGNYINFCLYRLQEVLLMVHTPFHIWL